MVNRSGKKLSLTDTLKYACNRWGRRERREQREWESNIVFAWCVRVRVRVVVRVVCELDINVILERNMKKILSAYVRA